jgi:hypothetical protein
VIGRVDRLGEAYTLTASLYDSQRGFGLAKPRAEATEENGLRLAADRIAAELLAELGIRSPSKGAERPADDGSGVVVGIKLGNQFLTSLAALNPGAELELGWAINPEWVTFLQVGINLVRGRSEGQEVGLTVVPSVLGLRSLYRVQATVQPYWGLGMGLQLSMGKFGPLRQTESLPTVNGMLGSQFRLTPRWAAVFETSINLAQLVLGFSRQSGLGEGFNLDLSLGLLYRF